MGEVGRVYLTVELKRLRCAALWDVAELFCVAQVFDDVVKVAEVLVCGFA